MLGTQNLFYIISGLDAINRKLNNFILFQSVTLENMVCTVPIHAIQIVAANMHVTRSLERVHVFLGGNYPCVSKVTNLILNLLSFWHSG